MAKHLAGSSTLGALSKKKSETELTPLTCILWPRIGSHEAAHDVGLQTLGLIDALCLTFWPGQTFRGGAVCSITSNQPTDHTRLTDSFQQLASSHSPNLPCTGNTMSELAASEILSIKLSG